MMYYWRYNEIMSGPGVIYSTVLGPPPFLFYENILSIFFTSGHVEIFTLKKAEHIRTV